MASRTGAVQSVRLFDGWFRVSFGGGITNFTLNEPLARCPRRGSAAQRKPKSRKLWGNGTGRFRTTGNYSAATVRGTRWLVQDTCAGTRTRVTAGQRERARPDPQAHGRDPRAARDLPRAAAPLKSRDRSRETPGMGRG